MMMVMTSGGDDDDSNVDDNNDVDNDNDDDKNDRDDCYDTKIINIGDGGVYCNKWWWRWSSSDNVHLIKICGCHDDDANVCMQH